MVTQSVILFIYKYFFFFNHENSSEYINTDRVEFLLSQLDFWWTAVRYSIIHWVLKCHLTMHLTVLTFNHLVVFVKISAQYIDFLFQFLYSDTRFILHLRFFCSKIVLYFYWKNLSISIAIGQDNHLLT